MALESIPLLVRHCTVAVYKKLHGDKKSRFMEAFEIARAQLMKYGYLTHQSVYGSVEDIRLTPKGRRREQLHRREGSKGQLKNKLFAELFQASELALTEASQGEPQVRDRDERKGQKKQ